MFVKADYIKSLAKCDCRHLLPCLKKRLQELSEKEILPDEEKHVRSEMFALQARGPKYDRPRQHRFIGYQDETEIILMTNRNHRKVTVDQLPESEVKMLAGGVKFRTTHLGRCTEDPYLFRSAISDFRTKVLKEVRIICPGSFAGRNDEVSE